MPAQALEVGTRAELRKPTVRDAELFLRMVRESRSLHRPWVEPPEDHDSYMRYLRRLRGSASAGFLVCVRGDAEAIAGVININEIVRGNFQSATLGYYGAAQYTGAGLMTEGMRLVLRHAFGPMRLHRLEANIQPENDRSVALAKRCGFRYEGFSPRFLKIAGQWRDHERWAILSDELRNLGCGRRETADGRG